MEVIHPFPFLLLALAAYRVTRFVGWDDLTAAARNRVIGWNDGHLKRPRLWHFIQCPFCVGFWVSLAAYGCWLWQPRWTLYCAVPLALAAVVGLTAKRLDP